MYIYIFNLGIDKGEITYIYLEELTYIYLFIYLESDVLALTSRQWHQLVEPKTRSSIHPSIQQSNWLRNFNLCLRQNPMTVTLILEQSQN